MRVVGCDSARKLVQLGRQLAMRRQESPPAYKGANNLDPTTTSRS